METELLTRKFERFVKWAWHLIEPATELVWNWHLSAMCDHLQALVDGRLKSQKLLINVPPGTSKSSIVTVLFGCWLWTRAPETSMMFASHGMGLSLRDSVRRRDYVLSSQEYQARWGHLFKLNDSQQAKGEFLNSKTGFMFSTSVNGDCLGRRAAVLMLDDPHKVSEAESEAERENTTMWLNQEWSMRRNRNAPITAEICVMQRLHENDASGLFLKQGGWTHLKLPMYFEPEKPCVTEIGFSDPRKNQGEVLDAARFTPEILKDMETRLGPYGVAGQLQQRPSPAEGGIIKVAWLKRYPGTVPKMTDEVVIEDSKLGRMTLKPIDNLRFCTIDPATSDKEIVRGSKLSDPDWFMLSAWMAWNTTRGPFLVQLDCDMGKWGGEVHDQKIENFHALWNFSFICVESVAFQLSLFQRLKSKGLPMKKLSKSEDDETFVTIDGDKTARAYNASPLMADGRFWMPTYAWWLGEVVKQMVYFPNADHDDALDSATYAVAIVQKIRFEALQRQVDPQECGNVLRREDLPPPADDEREESPWTGLRTSSPMEAMKPRSPFERR